MADGDNAVLFLGVANLGVDAHLLLVPVSGGPYLN